MFSEYCYPLCFGATFQNKLILVLLFDFSLYTVIFKAIGVLYFVVLDKLVVLKDERRHLPF